MTENMFSEAYAIVMHHEGGYAFDPDDPGGETYKGISRVFWFNWQGWQIIDQIKTNYPRPEWNTQLKLDPNLQDWVLDFYKINFWDTLQLDALSKYSKALATDLFDMGVNLGIGQTGEYFQRSLNAANNRGKLYPNIPVDGRIGPRTLKMFEQAVTTRGIPLIYKLVNICQGYHYFNRMEQNESQEKWIGWFNRVDFIS